jgi:glucosamine kinase
MKKHTVDKDKLNRIIGKNISRLMNRKQMSALQLSKKCGPSPASIGRIANGSIGVSLEMCLKLAYGLDVSIIEILKGIPTLDQKIMFSEETDEKSTETLSIGILSIKDKRVTCIKDHEGNIIGESELQGGLDLAETSSTLIAAIQEAILEANAGKLPNEALKNAEVKLVMQSYEFEDARRKFIQFAKRHFQDVFIIPDWRITYLAAFKDDKGISLIVDKGVSLSFMHNGTLKKVGGWKFPVYDLGGENWLGIRAIRHTIEAKEKFIPMTPLARSILAKHNGKIEKITEICFKGSDHDIYSMFSEPLMLQYLKKDQAAIEIVNEGFGHIQKVIGLADETIGKKLPIALNGSLSDIYGNFIEKSRLYKTTTSKEKAQLLADVQEDE